MLHPTRVVFGVLAESIRSGESMQRVYDKATTVTVGSWVDPIPRFDVEPEVLNRVLAEMFESPSNLSALGGLATNQDTQLPPQ